MSLRVDQCWNAAAIRLSSFPGHLTHHSPDIVCLVLMLLPTNDSKLDPGITFSHLVTGTLRLSLTSFLMPVISVLVNPASSRP